MAANSFLDITSIKFNAFFRFILILYLYKEIILEENFTKNFNMAAEIQDGYRKLLQIKLRK
jgi:hypothetical protein